MSLFFIIQIGFVLISAAIIVYLLLNRMGSGRKHNHTHEDNFQ